MIAKNEQMSDKSKKPVISMNGIIKKYYIGTPNELEVLKGIDLTVYEGEFVAIVGASGSGKSTLMNIIGSLDRPTEGNYQLEDVDITTAKDSELSKIRNHKIGFVFQTYNLIAKMNAMKNVEMPMLYAGLKGKARIARAKELLILLFEYVKINSVGYKLNKKRADIVELVRSCVADQYTLIEEREMILEIDLPETEIYQDIDVVQMKRVINNLLLNAITHNPNETKLLIRIVQYVSGIEIRIADSGEQISEKLEQEIFYPFVQADPSRHSAQGSGLGLSISKKIVEMHGGTLSLQQGNMVGYTKVFTIQL